MGIKVTKAKWVTPIYINRGRGLSQTKSVITNAYSSVSLPLLSFLDAM